MWAPGQSPAGHARAFGLGTIQKKTAIGGNRGCIVPWPRDKMEIMALTAKTQIHRFCFSLFKMRILSSLPQTLTNKPGTSSTRISRKQAFSFSEEFYRSYLAGSGADGRGRTT